MDKQTLNRLNYLRKNKDYLNRRELMELDRLETTFRTDQALAQDQARAIAFAQRERAKTKQLLAERQAAELQQWHFDESVPSSDQAVSADNGVLSADGTSRLVHHRKKSKKLPKSPKLPKEKKPFRWLKRIAIVLAVLLIAAIAGVAYMMNTTESAFKKTQVNTGNSVISTDKPLTVLLMGVDTGDASRGGSGSWNGNSDSQIVMTLNPKTNTTTMVSMERDTMTNILDNSGNQISQQKMNAAYPAGYNAGGITTAAQYAMKTIGSQVGLNLNNFVVINMDGLVNLVNDVGGIDVVNDSGATITISNTEPEYTATVPYIEGNPEQHINGDQALVFARDRDTLPNGDYGRAAHQREVLTAVFKKLLTFNTLSRYNKLLSDISGDFKTNLSADTSNILALLAYRSCFNKIVSIQYQGIPATAAGSDGTYASYQFMPTDVDLAVQNTMLRANNESTITKLSKNVITYESYYGEDPTDPYYMPSATVTEKGKTPVTYGIDTFGNLVTITASNAGEYVSTTGGAVSK